MGIGDDDGSEFGIGFVGLAGSNDKSTFKIKTFNDRNNRFGFRVKAKKKIKRYFHGVIILVPLFSIVFEVYV